MWRRRTTSALAGLLLAWNGAAIVTAQEPGAAAKPLAPQAATSEGACSALFGKHADLWWNYCCQKRPEHSPVRNYHPLVRAKEAILPHHCHHGGTEGCCSECSMLVGHPAFRHGESGAGHGAYEETGYGKGETRHQHSYQPVQIAPPVRNEPPESDRSTHSTDFRPPVQLTPPREADTSTRDTGTPVPSIPVPVAEPQRREPPSTTPPKNRIPRNLIPPRFRPDEP